MNKTLSVAAIQNGTVIDHINSDQTLRIIHMLKLLNTKHTVTVGFNLPSNRMKIKDMIKINDHHLTEREADEINVFAPQATIAIIKDYVVVKKMVASLPTSIGGVFLCPNPNCISAKEPVESFFKIVEQGHLVKLVCKFCEKMFDRKQAHIKT